MNTFWRIVLLALALSGLAFSQEKWLAPPDTLILDGVPPIPSSLKDGLNKYFEVNADSIAGWDPVKLEPIIIRKPFNYRWELRRVNTPGWLPRLERLLPVGTVDTLWDRQGRYV